MSVNSVRRLLSSTIALSFVVAATPAHAQVRNWDNYCTTGSLQLCMSIGVSIVLVPNPGGNQGSAFTQFTDQTRWPTLASVTVTIQNLEGVLGSNVAWGLEAIDIQHLTNTAAPGTADIFATGTLEGNAQNVGASFLAGDWFAGASPDGHINRSPLSFDNGLAIVGCTPLAGQNPFGLGYISTCGPGSAVAFTFLMPPFAFTDSTFVRVNGFVGTTGIAPTFSCTFNIDCVQVAPEPSTMALTASGLLCFGVIARRRRRRGCA